MGLSGHLPRRKPVERNMKQEERDWRGGEGAMKVSTRALEGKRGPRDAARAPEQWKGQQVKDAERKAARRARSSPMVDTTVPTK